MTQPIVFIGCGDIATRCAVELHRQKQTVIAVRRSVQKLPAGLPAVAADVFDPKSLEFLRQLPSHTVVYTLAASGFDEQSYRKAYIDGLKHTIAACSNMQRLIFVSSTSVYHQNDSSVVNEESATEPTGFNGQIMLEGEKAALNTGVATVVRFSGIYGPARLRMIDRVRAGQCSHQSDAFTNRIHSYDCSGILSFLLKRQFAEPHRPGLPEILIGTDSQPATLHEVEEHIAHILNMKMQYTDKTQSKRRAGSKQCSNQKLLSLGYKLLYPDYKSGYQQLISSP